VMGDISFGQTVGMLKNAMDGAGTAHSVIANNIANVNTPNFRRSDVSGRRRAGARAVLRYPRLGVRGLISAALTKWQVRARVPPGRALANGAFSLPARHLA
jgi:hypothetical protein